MSTVHANPEPRPASGVSTYVGVCVAALFALALALWLRRFGRWCLFPPCIGLLALIFRWRTAPQMVLLALGGLFLAFSASPDVAFGIRLEMQTRIQPGDLLAAAALLVYVVATCRLRSLEAKAFPHETRRDKKKPPPRPAARNAPPAERHTRSPHLVTPWEISRLLLTVPIWVALAPLCWRLLPASWGGVDLAGGFVLRLLDWRLLLLIWILAGAMLLGAALVNYLRLQGQRDEEALMQMQDVHWQETCRERRKWARRLPTRSNT